MPRLSCSRQLVQRGITRLLQLEIDPAALRQMREEMVEEFQPAVSAWAREPCLQLVLGNGKCLHSQVRCRRAGVFLYLGIVSYVFGRMTLLVVLAASSSRGKDPGLKFRVWTGGVSDSMDLWCF